jgi:hypothetical protein
MTQKELCDFFKVYYPTSDYSMFIKLREQGYYYDEKWNQDKKAIRNYEQEWIEFEKHPIGFSKYTQDELKNKQIELPMKKEYKELMHQLKINKYAEKNPNFPPDYIPKTMYKDSTANGLTKAICDFINYHGYQAERINTMGVARTKTATDGRVLGVTWTKGTSTAGSADISATIKGRSVKIEVKIGKDRQSDAQKRYQENIEKAGGTYYIARNFDDFVDFFNDFVNK